MNPSGKQKLRRVGGYPVYPLPIGGVGVEGEMPVLYNRMQTLILARPSKTLRKWWNWQTHHLEGVAPKGMRVQVPPSAPIRYSASGDIYCVQPLVVLKDGFDVASAMEHANHVAMPFLSGR